MEEYYSSLIELKNVSLNRDDDLLHNVSLAIERGENYCFFGPELSGLGALFPLILGFIEKYKGEVLYRGKDISTFGYIESLLHKKSIGYLHGEYGLISNMTVRQNIALPMEYHSELSHRDVVDKVNDLIDEMNLDHCKNLRPIALTHSEILKTAYARSVVMEPELLMVEHGFESQSPVNINAFMNHLKDFSRDRTNSVLFVTYEPEKLVDLVDHYIMVFNGRVVFTGSNEEFFSTDNPYVVQFKKGADTGPMVLI